MTSADFILTKVLLVHQALGAQVASPDVKDKALSVVQVLLQLSGALLLLDQDTYQSASRAGIAGQTEDVQACWRPVGGWTVPPTACAGRFLDTPQQKEPRYTPSHEAP